MLYKDINQAIGNLDLYLLDQILKGTFDGRQRILDAGCGEGRNLTYFVNNGYEVYGIDKNPQALLMAMMTHKAVPKENWTTGDLSENPHPDLYFDAVLCSAVLHFADNYQHFHKIMNEIIRVLAPDGILFIRTATAIGLSEVDDNSSFSYLLEPEQLYNFNQLYPLNFLELPKSVVVNGQRSMGILVMQKK
mgnify:CR=1 FL=1